MKHVKLDKFPGSNQVYAEELQEAKKEIAWAIWLMLCLYLRMVTRANRGTNNGGGQVLEEILRDTIYLSVYKGKD